MELQCITDIKKNFPLGFELGTCGVRGRRLTDVATETAGSWGETWYLSMLALTTVGAIRDTGGQIFVIDEQKKKTITRELWHFVLYYYHSCIFVVLGKMLISVLVLELSEEKKKNLENVYIEPTFDLEYYQNTISTTNISLLILKSLRNYAHNFGIEWYLYIY